MAYTRFWGLLSDEHTLKQKYLLKRKIVYFDVILTQTHFVIS